MVSVLDLIAFVIGIITPYKIWERLSIFIFPIAVILCILVFIPGIGYAHGGARRWIDVFGFNLQPSEILKYANIFLLGSSIILTIKTKFFTVLNIVYVPLLMLFTSSKS
jgi:cell division protein FtsW